MTELFQTMGNMDSIDIGLWVTGAMLVFVLLGVRVAFAAATAGFLGLVWIFYTKLGVALCGLLDVKIASPNLQTS